MMDVTVTSTTREKRSWLQRLTLAHGLLALIVVLTAVSRLVNLGQIPLSPAEAETAWAVWRFWQPGSVMLSLNSPAYFSLTAPLTQILGVSDAVVRLLPALTGIAVVLIPWLLRQRLGVIGALTASFVLAVSPLHMITARTVGGDGLALLALLLLITAVLRYAATRHHHWALAGGGALALGLTGAPLFYGGLATLGVAWMLARLTTATPAGVRVYLQPLGRDGGRNTAVFTLALFLGLSTMLLWHLPGLGVAAGLPARWLGQFAWQPDALLTSLIAFLRYEPLLALLGITAVFWALRSGSTLAHFCVAWLGGLLLLALLQPGYLPNAVLMTLPSAFLLGLFANHILERAWGRLTWAWAGGLTFIGFLIFVNLARFLRVVTFNPQEMATIWVILLAFTVAVVTVYFLGSWDITAVYQGTLLGLLVLLSFFQWGTGWWLSQHAANDPRARWVTAATDDDVRVMVQLLTDISRQASNSPDGLEIFSSVDSPVLRWYLRDFQRAQFGAVLPLDARNAVLLTPAEGNLTPGEDYAGADFALQRNIFQAQPTESSTPVFDALRWWLFHESSLTFVTEDVILWWRIDLAEG